MKKRVIAVSDSHGDHEGLKLAFLQAMEDGKVDVAVFLGDGLSDFETVRPWLNQSGILCYAVRGNNDWSSSENDEVCFSVNGVRFYACHGHRWRVKYDLSRLWYAAREYEAQVALYGHTHSADVDLQHGMYLVNPGAVCNRFCKGYAYADIDVEDNGGIRVQLRKWR